MNRIFLTAILSLAIIILFQQCNPRKKLIKQPIKELGVDYLINQLKKNEFQFEWLDAKFSADFSIDGNISTLKGTIRLRKDSAIWASISPAFGIEMARILITQDSLKLMNRIDGTYIKSDFSYINKLLETNFDFDILQALLLGNDLTCYENDKFKAHLNEKKYLLTTVGRRKIKKFVDKNDKDRIILQDIWLDPGTYKIERISLKDIKISSKIDSYYSGFQASGNQIFPTELYFDFNNKRAVKLTLKMNKVEINSPKNLSFKIPSKYININADE